MEPLKDAPDRWRGGRAEAGSEIIRPVAPFGLAPRYAGPQPDSVRMAASSRRNLSVATWLEVDMPSRFLPAYDSAALAAVLAATVLSTAVPAAAQSPAPASAK